MNWRTLGHLATRAARGVGLDTWDAEEVAQDAVCLLLRRSSAIAIADPEAWLGVVTRRLAKRARAERDRRRAVLCLTDPVVVAESCLVDGDHEGHAIVREVAVRLLAVIRHGTPAASLYGTSTRDRKRRQRFRLAARQILTGA